jgi:hypothetical protein
MQEIIYPNELKIADINAELEKRRFKHEVNSDDPLIVLEYLIKLPSLLNEKLAMAKTQNPERCRRDLIRIRQHALEWLQLDNIESIPCNIRLYEIKRELRWIADETQRIYETLPSMRTVPSSGSIKDDTTRENDILVNINKYLIRFKEGDIIENEDYELLLLALVKYFMTGIFPSQNKVIIFRKVSQKRLGWALNLVYRANKTSNEKLPFEYLSYAKQNISVFLNAQLNENDLLGSNLYIYFTSRVK